MKWIIIALLLLAAFGPVLWLVPSARDRRLSALREQARREGLLVELRRLPNLNPTPEERVTAGGRIKRPEIACTAYMQPLPRRLVSLPTWRLLRGNEAPQVRPGWQFDPEFRARGEQFEATLQALEPLISGVPADVIGLEMSDRSLGVYWLETAVNDRSTVTRLAVLLADGQRRVLELDDRFQAAAEDANS